MQKSINQTSKSINWLFRFGYGSHFGWTEFLWVTEIFETVSIRVFLELKNQLAETPVNPFCTPLPLTPWSWILNTKFTLLWLILVQQVREIERERDKSARDREIEMWEIASHLLATIWLSIYLFPLTWSFSHQGTNVNSLW